jgi:ribosomal protein L6P/L9E
MSVIHSEKVVPPEGISFDVDTKTRQIKVMGYDSEQVGKLLLKSVYQTGRTL